MASKREQVNHFLDVLDAIDRLVSGAKRRVAKRAAPKKSKPGRVLRGRVIRNEDDER